MHHLGSGFATLYAWLRPGPHATAQATSPAHLSAADSKNGPPPPPAASQQQGLPQPNGLVEPPETMGVYVDPVVRPVPGRVQILDPTTRQSCPRALGGAAGWSFTAQPDGKSPGTDRRLLARLCEVARLETERHAAIGAVARAAPPLPPAPSTLQRLARAEALREAGRAMVREFPDDVMNRSVGVVWSIAASIGSAFEITAMVHGICLEIRHQRLCVPREFLHWHRLGDRINGAIDAGVQLTEELSSRSWNTARLHRMPLEQALLFLSSLRYHVQTSDRDIDSAAAAIRTRPDLTDEVAQVIEQMVPTSGEDAAQSLLGAKGVVFGDRGDVEGAVGHSLDTHCEDLTPHLFSTAADVFVRSHRYHAIQDAGLDKPAAPRPAKAGGPAHDDDIREEDFLTRSDLDSFLAFERALGFYDAYHQHGLTPLLTWARRAGPPLPPALQRALRRHARVLCQELAELDQRPYIQAALRPFAGSKQTQREALRARIRHPLARIEALLRQPTATRSTSTSTLPSTSASSSSTTTTSPTISRSQ